jgi:exonuclease SbcC
MFDFLSKFLFRRPKNDQAAGKVTIPSAIEVAAQQQAENKKQQVEQARTATLAKISALTGSTAEIEAAAIQLLLACDFADGRLQAAQHVHSQQGLEQVRAAMLKTDKRVAKLMQSRLDLIAETGKQAQLAQLCLEEATHLAQQAHLLANQVTELDKRRAAVQFPVVLVTQFDQLRQKIEAKLLAQTALQRRVLDLLSELNQVTQAISSESAVDGAAEHQAGADVDQLDQLSALELRVAAWQQELDQCQNQAEAASLPKNVLAEASKKLQERQQALKALQQVRQLEQQREQQRQEKIEQRNAQLAAQAAAALAASAVNAADAEGVTIGEPSDLASADATEQAPQVPAADVQSAKSERRAASDKPVSKLSSAQIVAAIEAMSEALAQGSIQAARKLDKELRNVDARTAGLNTEQKEKLFEARNELVYLQGWAKWGGDVSRDELIKTLDEMPALELAPNELAKKVAALRERWKEMEATSGAAGKEVWERFDAACHLAYAPAALHFQQQAEQRKANLETADAALLAVRASVEQLLQGAPDWKKIANFCMQSQQDWKKLGHVDRKHKSRLDADFEAAVQPAQQALDQRRKEEILSREYLIAEVLSLDPLQRNTTDQLKALQQRWQAQAAAVPLRRKDEQVLWDKYRAACDGLFAQRKQASGEADAQRQENLAARVALCEELEQAIAAFEAHGELNIGQLLSQSAASWRSAGPAPRAEEEALEQRYQQALSSLKQHGQNLQDQKKYISQQAFLKKMAVCQKAEQLLTLTSADSLPEQLAGIQAEWSAISEATAQLKLPAKLNSLLQARFQAAGTALEESDSNYATLLQNNRAEFDATLLHLEILSGIDSPAELARERLQMQVEVLQNAMKRGAQQDAATELAYRLLSLPVLADASTSQRLEKVLAASAVL